MSNRDLKNWGRRHASQVQLDASTESRHNLSLENAWGGTFKMLGVTFDGTLTMSDAVAEVVAEAGWKLHNLLRTKRYYTDADLIMLYKAHLLSYLEYRTPPFTIPQGQCWIDSMLCSLAF